MRPRFTFKDAYDSAMSNAQHFGRMYAVFCDTNGNWRAVSEPRDTHVAFGIVYPDGTESFSTVETTVGQLKTQQRTRRTK